MLNDVVNWCSTRESERCSYRIPKRLTHAVELLYFLAVDGEALHEYLDTARHGFLAGLVGGTINALLSDNGFVLPKQTEGIFHPGWLGNALIGGVAAAVSWSLYGPLAGAAVVSATAQRINLTVRPRS